MERYQSLNSYLKKTYGEKLYKLSLNGGMTCPNRDGTLGNRGCIFCSAGGSGDFTSPSTLSVTEQIEAEKNRVAGKYTGSSYIAYFQAYTNTYAPVDRLRELFTEAILHPEIRVLSIATRPDCLGPEVISLLAELNRIKPVWVELGLQTIHESTASYIRRGYPLSAFDEAVSNLRSAGIQVIVHLILGLPGEDAAMMLASINYLNRSDIQGVKLQLLHVLKGTDLEKDFRAGTFSYLSMEEYFSVLGSCINHLRPDIVLHRLTGDGPKSLLLSPLWSADKKRVLNSMRTYFEQHDIRQGKEFLPWHPSSNSIN